MSRRCVGCGRPEEAVERLSNKTLCPECSAARMIAQIDSAHAKSGPGYERLLAGQAKARRRRQGQ